MDYARYDPFDVVRIFERQVAAYAGASYGCAVNCCSAALLLCCTFLKVRHVTIPARTHPAAANAVVLAGGMIGFEDVDWAGDYFLKPYPIIDSALRFTRGMHVSGTYRCLSFHYAKHLKIGGGGMILHDDSVAQEAFIEMRRHGLADGASFRTNTPKRIGWNCPMDVKHAATGLQLLSYLPDHNADLQQTYPSLAECDVYSRDR